jgi:hypothetical protein
MAVCVIDWTALGTWVLAVVTFLTLIKVKQYAQDTKRLVVLTEKQSEAAIAPFLAVVQKPDDLSGNGYFFKNQGRGPALNIRYRAAANGRGDMEPIYSPMAQDETKDINELYPPWAAIQGFLLIYESLSGATYQTKFYFSDKGALLTSFGRLTDQA